MMINLFNLNDAFCAILQAGYVGEDVESILYKLLTVYFILQIHKFTNNWLN